jgi:alpha-tubulin suppressor-like RCC1 family protein
VIAYFPVKTERMTALAKGHAGTLGTFCAGRTLRSVVVCVLVLLAAVCGGAPTPAQAEAACPVSSDPYTAPSAVLHACGTHILPQQSRTSMPYGGTRYTYQEPSGDTISLTAPPASFDAGTASPSELATFGIPPEPPAGSPEYADWKAMISKGIHFVAPPAALSAVPPRHASQAAIGTAASDAIEPVSSFGATGNSSIWSGYFNWNGKGGYTHATAYFVEPSDHGSCSNASSGIWAGIGGWYNKNLGQDGTSQQTPGLGNHQAWIEVLPEAARAAMPELYASPGHWFLADTQYNGGGEYSFYLYNYANGKAAHGTATGGFDGNVADFIVERSNSNLFNFGSVALQGYTNGKAFGQYPTERVNMWNNKGELNAGPSGIANKYAFNDKYYHCTGSTSEETFGEGEGTPPATTTGAASGVTEKQATLNATVNPEGADTRYHFEYGTEAGNYSFSTPESDAGSGSSSVPVSSAITELQAGTTYHFRVIANSQNGINAGNDATFTTTGQAPPPPPTVTTEGVSGIGPHTATLEGSVNPNGLDTHYYFEYGRNPTLYENDAPALPGSDVGAGSVPVHASVGVAELAPFTTYYYRLVASNATGTSYGAEKEFTTTATGTFSAGAYHTCALVSTGGSIDCWGENYYGQLGNGTNKNISTKPVAVSGITTAIEVAGGGEHTCALLTGSKIDCWGYNHFGELGNGTTKNSSTPVAVSGISTAIQVSAGYAHTCALLSGGKIDCWGENAYEQLGNGTTTNSSTPVAVSGISTATSVTAGGFGTCAVLSGGSVDCWGYGEFGELGNGTTKNSSTPVKVTGISNAVAVTAVGYFQACAQLSTGTIDCWGDNEDGELGNGTTTNSSTPVAVSGITTGAGVAAGAFHTCGLLSTKSLRCWGENYFGELGNGTTTNSTTPVTVSGIATAAGIIAGTYHSCGRLIGGSVDCWGENAFGQLGNGTTTNSSTPVAVSGLP